MEASFSFWVSMEQQRIRSRRRRRRRKKLVASCNHRFSWSSTTKMNEPFPLDQKEKKKTQNPFFPTPNFVVLLPSPPFFDP
jgi:hypothetical protein